MVVFFLAIFYFCLFSCDCKCNECDSWSCVIERCFFRGMGNKIVFVVDEMYLFLFLKKL